MAMAHISLPVYCGRQGQGQAIVRGWRLKRGRKVGRGGSAISMEFLQRRTSLHAKVDRD